jgi:hypothetical protein
MAESSASSSTINTRGLLIGAQCRAARVRRRQNFKPVAICRLMSVAAGGAWRSMKAWRDTVRRHFNPRTAAMNSPRSTSISINLLLAALALLPLAATAQDRAAIQACKPDLAKFCPGIKPGGGRIAECLKQHEAELAPACQATVAKVAECGPDIKKFCGAASAPAALRECIKSHASELSPACRAAAAK